MNILEKYLTQLIESSGDFKEEKVKKGLKEALNFFEDEVTRLRGTRAAGIKGISELVFATVCLIYIKTIKDIRGIDDQILFDLDFNEIKERFEKIKDINLMKLLYHMLNFEEELQSLPSYREHFVHSFHVFTYGLIINNLLDGMVLKDKFKEWFIISIFHDVGYPLSKLQEFTNKFIDKILCHGENNPDYIEHDIPVEPNWAHFLVFDFFYRSLIDDKNIWKKFNGFVKYNDDWNPNQGYDFEFKNYKPDDGLKKTEKIEKFLKYVTKCNFLHHQDHGIFSALLIYYNSYMSRQKLLDKEETIKIFWSILLHNLFGWSWQFTKYGKINNIEKTTKNIMKEHDKHHPCSPPFIIKGKLPLLLLLSDVLAQIGRELQESNLEIKMSRFEKKRSFLEIILSYLEKDDPSSTRELEEKRIEYYENPLKGHYKISNSKPDKGKYVELNLANKHGDLCKKKLFISLNNLIVN